MSASARGDTSSAVERLAASGGGPGRRVVALLAAALVLSVVAVGWLLVSARSAEQRADAEVAATKVARERAAQLASYAADTFEADTAWAGTGATQRFAEEYAAANEPIEQVARHVQARAVGNVVEAVGHAVSRDEVEVLLFVDQTITRGVDGKQSTERSRVVMTLVHRDGAWLVDDVALR